MNETAAQTAIDGCVDECAQSLRAAFDTTCTIKTGPGKATLSSSQGFRTRIWSDLEKAFCDEIFCSCKQVKFLQGIINNFNQSPVAASYWKKLSETITKETNSSSAAIQQALESDYPKLLKLYSDMIQKLSYEHFVFKYCFSSSYVIVTQVICTDFSRDVFEKWENAYLSTSLSALLEPTQAMFKGESAVPTHDQIDSLIRIVTKYFYLCFAATVFLQF